MTKNTQPTVQANDKMDITNMKAAEIRTHIEAMATEMGISVQDFATQVGVEKYNGNTKKADLMTIYDKMEDVHIVRVKYVNAIKPHDESVNMQMTREDLKKKYDAIYNKPANDETSAAGNKSKEEKKMKNNNMVTREYMDQQLALLQKGHEEQINALMARFENMLKANESTPAPAPAPAPIMPVPAPSAPATPEEVVAEAKAKLDAVKVEDEKLRLQVNTLAMQLSQYPVGSKEYNEIHAQLNAASGKRKITVAYIRSCTADGLRKFADVQESSVGGFIEWTRGGLIAIVNLLSDGAKTVNTGVANGVRFTADVVDPNATIQFPAPKNA